MRRKTAILLLLALCASGCHRVAHRAMSHASRAAYEKQILAWKTRRIDRLRAEDGWLTLVGLFWLDPGENRVGSDPASRVVLPAGKTPAKLGVISLANGKTHFTAAPSAPVTLANGLPATSVDLQSDDNGAAPTILKTGSVMFYVIKRGDKLGVRVKDTESEARKDFHGIDTYPIDPKWRVEAVLERPAKPRTIPIANVLGMTDEEPSPGTLTFQIDGKTYHLDPVIEVGEKDYFIILADATTGKETYGAGRFLSAAPPGPDGKVVVDFNKTYNPPCVFTKYATCPLPPPQNRLPIAVTAGEKKYGNH